MNSEPLHANSKTPRLRVGLKDVRRGQFSSTVNEQLGKQRVSIMLDGVIIAFFEAKAGECGYVLSDELSLVPTPGHSPGHVCIDLKSRGERALFTGDMMHHCAQVIAPDWSSCFCYDVKESAATRWKFFREHVNTGTLIIPTHFPGTTAGRIEKFRDTFEFRFLAA